MKRNLLLSALALAFPFALVAQVTQVWRQNSYKEFEKGTAKGVALRSDGVVELAPQFKQLYASGPTYLWAIASDKAGNVYAAAGSPARLYRVTPAGRAETIFQPTELQVQAVVERDGVIYAATGPDGKIYRITQEPEPGEKNSGGENGWDASIYFDPHVKYIWALAMDAKGQLYAGTGDQGQIFRITAPQKGSVFFQSADAHIRSLAFDEKGDLIAGSDGSGLIYRISPAGEAFVLYSAPKKEITALAIDADGNIYAAGLGEKRSGGAAAPPVISAPILPANGAAPLAAAPPIAPLLPMPENIGGSDVYRITPDGAPSLVWISAHEIVYALAFGRVDSNEELLAGTGNKGRVYGLGKNGTFAALEQASASQITGFASAPAGGEYVCTSNLGKIFLLSAAAQHEGTMESSVLDARLFSRWGKLRAHGSGELALETRSGNVENPDTNWSPWTKVSTTGAAADEVQSPAARFLQWRATLHAGAATPSIASVEVDYVNKNVAPVVDSVTVDVAGSNAGAAAPPAAPAANEAATAASAPASQHAITIKWAAHDDDGDQLSYQLFYRGAGEKNWLPLAKKPLTEKSYDFEPDLLPDGSYRIKVVASDAPTQSPQNALSGSRESQGFVIDTTPPQVLDLHAAMESGSLHVTFRAMDALSAVRRAEYSLDAGDWQFIAPVGEVSDSREEHYDFNIALPPGAPPSATAASTPNQTAAGGEHVLAVRAYDEYGNRGSAKLLVH